MDGPARDTDGDRQAPPTEPSPAGTADPALDGIRRRAMFVVAHRLRTPLSLVLGPLELLAQSDDLKDRDRQHVTVAAENAVRVRDGVEQMAEIAAWPSHTDARDVDVVSVLHRVVSARQADAAQQNIAIELAGRTTRTVHADQTLLGWALDAIIAEAVARAEPNMRVEITVDEVADDDTVAVTVVVLDDDADRFLDLEDHLEASAVGGVARDIVALQQGHVATVATAGRARALRVALPSGNHRQLPDESGGRVSQPLRAEGAVGRHTGVAEPVGPEDAPLVMVVEDDDELRAFLQRTLSTDHRVVTAATAQEGLEVARQLHPELIICDIVMPHGSGEQLVHAIDRDESMADVAIIVLTGRTDEQLRVRLLRDGADDYVTKPFAVGELRARMANLETSRLDIEDLQTKVTQARDLADQLQHALSSRVIIEQAKGLLAAHLSTDVSEAFEVLRRYARNNNLRLHDLARDVVERGFRP